MPKDIGNEINEILYSGQLGYGKYGKIFENKLGKFLGCENVLSVNTFNIAMLVVLSTLGLKAEDEVIASPVSCLASNQPFAIKGIKVVWADIDPKFGGLCPDSVKSKITKKTKAIFHNHFCGYLGNITAINAIGREYGIPVVDDGIEAFGSKYKGNRLGNIGTDITVFSFQTVRLPNTIDGGAIVFNNKELYEKALLVRDYGIDRGKFRNENGEISSSCDIKLEGYGGLMSDLNSCIGIRQMDDIEELLQIQSKNSNYWKNKFYSHPEIQPLPEVDFCEPNFWVFGTLCENKEKSIKEFRENGFYATGVHINNNIYTVFKDKTKLKGVNEFMNRFVAIPSGWWVKNR
ncbi:DegT/DnrJ/EryC1/StrS family aminotransferase [Pedobacter sp. SL55]|uniref:DegT/DnrJ/EryC1/StrS family aminotransferase n=1 Tax=Pedobacter sp. SL55 TaxID=2995161 RepID=UPI00226FAD45|nr:DegT/DnrJ/EryC1/StrS family aminotransferase [Pedobacter sp. SL55]WAC41455.1 DegT/DnrJ/EryC1/StrS family aminotransferase [Pedobacter sp. SL55]